MEQRFMGTSGLRVSALTLGTMTWGRETDELGARAQLREFVDAGGTTFDTAGSYAEGRSEAILGEMLGVDVPRSDVVLISKAGISHRHGKRMVDTSRRAMLSALDASLARLGTDHLDLWLANIWDDNVPLEETLSALDYAVTSGRVRYAGVSNYSGWQLARAASICDTPLIANQVEYSLLERDAEREVVPAAEHVGAGILCWAPLGRGALTGKYGTGKYSAGNYGAEMPEDSRGASATMSGYIQKYLAERPARITDALVTAAQGLNRTPLDVALSWLLDHDAISAAVVGPRTPEQLKEILSSDLTPLPEEIVAVLREVSLG